MFQSSPSPKAGSYGAIRKDHRRGEVSILSQPEGRELLELRAAYDEGSQVSILSQPEGRELPWAIEHATGERLVSILSHPEGRELLCERFGNGYVAVVSILSQPEGRELPTATAALADAACFNPLPARRPGATRGYLVYPGVCAGFNPLPARRPGATGT